MPKHGDLNALIEAIAGPLIEELTRLNRRVAAVEAMHERTVEDDLRRTLGIEREPEPARVEGDDDALDQVYPELS